MVYYAIVVTFLMTNFINKTTNIVMDDWNLDEIHANYWNKVWCILHPNKYIVKYLDENHLVSDIHYNIVSL